MTDETSTLELKTDGTSARYYVCGRAVHCGEQLQVNIGGQWIYVRYEAQFRGQIITPIFYAVGGRVLPDDDAQFRWPQS